MFTPFKHPWMGGRAAVRMLSKDNWALDIDEWGWGQARSLRRSVWRTGREFMCRTRRW